jgi:S1-C subfamily serine protease
MLSVVLAGLFSIGVIADSYPRLGDSLTSSEHSVSPQQSANLSKSDGEAVYDTALDKGVLHKRLISLKPEGYLNTRGAKEANIYAKYSPSVVLVLTNDGIGSGSVIGKNGEILTNWHVIEGYEFVAVIYKPTTEGGKIEKRDLYRAQVIRIDEVADLALIRVTQPPAGKIPFTVGDASEIQIGLDVHAIGHPTGEAWTYTKGIISQFRKKYEWTTESNRQHVADVIQTQTPINPGNSGGPLISDNGNLVGVNSFKAQGEALNFAVSMDEVKRFLALTSSRTAAKASVGATASRSTECNPTKVGEARNANNTITITLIDFDCDGKPDGKLAMPDKKGEPRTLYVDSRGDGRTDSIYEDSNGNGAWDVSWYDTNGNGELDLIGYHPDGKLPAARFESYER